MFHNLVLLIVLVQPDIPAGFRFEVEASPHSDYGFSLNGQELDFGRLYRTEPLSAPVEVEFSVWFVNGERVIRQTLPLTLRPGTITIQYIRIPRVFPTIVEM